MGSKTFEGIWFIVDSHDHPPPHVHGKYAGIEVILELKDEGIDFARRKDRIRPPNAKHSDVVKIFNTAAAHESELKALWRTVHAASQGSNH